MTLPDDTPVQVPTPAPPPETCPECGRDLSGLDRFAHSLEHWAEQITPRDRSTLEARKRQARLLQRREPEE